MTLLLIALGLLAAAPDSAPPPLQPPVAPKKPHVREMHGDRFVDDYFWLRQKGTPEVEAHLRAERAYARAFLKPAAALEEKLYGEMLSRLQQTDLGVPYRERAYFYYWRIEEGRQYWILCRKKGTLEAAEEVVLDVDALAAGKTFFSVNETAISPDGALLAFTSDETGFRQYVLRIKDLRTGTIGPELAARVRSVAWAEDGRTLFYCVEHPQTKRSYQVFRHRLDAQGADELVYEEKDEALSMSVRTSRDREYVFVESWSRDTTEVRFVPARRPSEALRVVAPREPRHEYEVEHRDGVFWILTNDKGPNGRLVTAPVSDPARAGWKEVVAHRDDVMLVSLDLFADFYVLREREGGLPHLRFTQLGDGRAHRLEVPEAAYLVSAGINAEFDTKVYRFTYESPVTAPSTYDYDPVTRQRTLLKQTVVGGGFDPSRYKVELTRATAPDGTAVPMWVLSRKDVPRDGTAPALLYAYGAYGSAQTAYFSSSVFSLVDRGMVYAVAYVRGGSELGERWHEDGRVLKKKNTFTDFIAAAEHLVAGKYAARDRLAIKGASAGGLLVAAVLNMRPDLARVAVLGVPYVDAVNSMMDETIPLVVTEFDEWGNPKIEEHYRYMLSYSPYENLAARAYPAMLVKSSYNDSQVMYWEPAKYVARLRALKTDRQPLLFDIEMDAAGHGGRSGRYERLRDLALEYAFVLWQLGVEPVTASPSP